jgi:Dynamitin
MHCETFVFTAVSAPWPCERSEPISLSVMAGVEWVYEPHALPVDEPQLLEADSDRAATFDGKAQTLEGRDHGPPSEECVYYGDEDIDESLVDPVAAFETFAGHIFSSRQNNHSRSADNDMDEPHPIGIRPNKATCAGFIRDPTTGATGKILESRQERLSRLCREINEMSTTTEFDDDEDGPPGDHLEEHSKSMCLQLDDLRLALDRLSELSKFDMDHTKHKIVLKRQRPVPAQPANGPDLSQDASSFSPAYIELYAHDAVTLSDLDLRIRALERDMTPGADAVGARGIWGVLQSLHAQLEALDGIELDKMRANIESLTAAVNGDDRVAQLADFSDLFSKLDLLAECAGAIPALASRLRSIKTVLDDAAEINGAVADLNARYDSLRSARRENMDIVKQASTSLDGNMQTVRENMDSLQKRLEDLLN